MPTASVQTGLADKDDAGFHGVESFQPGTFAAAHGFDAIDNGQIDGTDAHLIDENTRDAVAGIARRIGMEFGIDAGRRFDFACVKHVAALFGGIFVAAGSTVAAI